MPKETNHPSADDQIVNFRKWHESVNDKLFRSLLFRVGSIDIVSEISQEAYLRIWQKWEQYGDDLHRTKSLFLIARNLAFDYFKHHQREMLTDINLDYLSGHSTQDSAEQLDKKTSIESLIKMLNLLSPEEKEIVIDRAIDNTSYTKIAKQLEKSEVAIRKTYSRALKKLKTLYQEHYGINFKPY